MNFPFLGALILEVMNTKLYQITTELQMTEPLFISLFLVFKVVKCGPQLVKLANLL